MTDSNFNILTKSRWIADIPAFLIDPSAGDLDIRFNLHNCAIPPLGVVSNDIRFQGYAVPVSAGVDASMKRMRFTYLLDSNATQYKFLWKWFRATTGEEGSGGKFSENTIPIVISLLSEFTNEVLQFRFSNCAIISLDAIDLSYADDTAIKHSFDVTYTKLDLIDK